jgi:hypothetical protein
MQKPWRHETIKVPIGLGLGGVRLLEVLPRLQIEQGREGEGQRLSFDVTCSHQ